MMEERNELSDIVLEKDEGSKNMKLKRILVIAAVLVLLFLAVLIIMRALNKPEQTQEARLVLPPEPQSVPAPQANEEKLFQQVPIIEEEEKESFEDMVKKLKEKEMQRTAQSNQTQEAPVTPAKETKPEPTPKPVQKVESAPKPAPKPAPVVQEKSPAPKPAQPEKVAQSGENLATSGTYIQVASVSKKNPDAAYLDSLTKKGYSYSLYRTKVNDRDITKILVGPYESNTAAKNALVNVKRDLASGAFVFRVP